MKKTIAALSAASLLGVALSFVGSSSAVATSEDGKCYSKVVDKEAYDETVVVTPAVDPIPEIPGVPAVEEVSHVVHHVATTKVVHHEAVTHEEYHFAKFTRERTKSPDTPGFWQNFEPNRNQGSFNGPPSWPSDSRGTWSSKKTNGGPQQGASGVFQNGSGNSSWFYRQQSVQGEWSAYGDWTKYSPETHTSWELSTTPLGSPQFHSSGTRDGVKWERQWQAQYDGQTRTITDKEAYDETVPDQAAYDETIIDVEASPAIPAIPAVPGVPAVTETVNHDATYKDVEVECPVVVVPPIVEPPVVEPPVVDPPITDTPPVEGPKIVEPKVGPYQPVKTSTVVHPDEVLPNTGGPSSLWILIGLGMVAVGTSLIARKAK